MLQLESLTIGYAHCVVARQLSCRLREGTLTALLGVNGVGKSTLLHTLTGRLMPLSGRILVQGTPLSALSLKERAMRMSVVFTQQVASSHLRVDEVVELGRTPYTPFSGRLSAADSAIVAEALSSMGLRSMSHRRIQTLSDGEQQRVMIAKALAQQAPIILLDEPTAYLDYPTKVETFLMLRRLAHQEGKTILLSTHDLELALRLCDNLWALSDACGLTEGTPQTFAENKVLDRLFSSDNVQFCTKQVIEHSPFKFSE